MKVVGMRKGLLWVLELGDAICATEDFKRSKALIDSITLLFCANDLATP